MITFQEFMLTSKHFCLIRSDIPFRLICNPNGGDWLSGTDICNLPAGSFTFDFWKLLPEKYFKNNPAFKLGLAYDADLLTDGRKIDVSYSDLDYGTGVAGLAGSSESSLAEIVLIDTLISNNLLSVLQKLETGNVSLDSIHSVLNDDIKQDVSDIQTSIEDNIAPDLSNAAFDVGNLSSFLCGFGKYCFKSDQSDNINTVFNGLYKFPRCFKCSGGVQAFKTVSGVVHYVRFELKRGYCYQNNDVTSWFFVGFHNNHVFRVIVRGSDNNWQIQVVDFSGDDTSGSPTSYNLDYVYIVF